MLPGFALNLSHSGIGLLRRVEGGWVHVGEASLASNQLTEDMKALRAKARKASDAPFFCKLVIPNSEILYTEVAAPGPSDAERLVQIRAALEGLTPYSVDELAFDWRVKGDRAQVAAVAQMTLREAEGFALDHKFPPACFVAIPEAQSAFDGEPFLGLPHTRPDDLAVARDPVAIVVLDRDPARPAEATGREPAPSKTQPAQPAKNTAAKEAPRNVQDRRESAQGPTDAAKDAKEAPEAAQAKALAAALAPRFTFLDAGSTEAGAGSEAPDAAAAPERAETKPDRIAEPDTPIGPEPIAAFVRAGASLTPAAGTPAPAKQGATGKTKPRSRTPDGKASTAPAATLVADPDDLPESESLLPLRKAQDPFPLPEFPARPTRDMTALKRKLLPIGGLAAVIALAMLGTQFLGTSNPVDLLRSNAPQAALTPADETSNVDLAALPQSDGAALLEPALIEGAESNDTEAGSDAEETVVLASLPDASAPVLLPEAESATPLVEEAQEAQPQAPEQPAQQGEAEGPSLNMLQGPGTTDSLYIASIDPKTEASDAVALPPMSAFDTDAPLAARSNPADAATLFALDENGWVIPTPEGALTPDGVRIFEGAPSKRATLRPADLAPVDLLAEADPLAGFRPSARPADIVESDERNRLGGRTLAQLATLRPAKRPVEMAAIAAALADAQEAADAAPPEESLFDLPTERAIARSPRPRVRPEIEVRRVAIAAPTATATAPAAKPAPSNTGDAEETGGKTTGQSLSRQEINSKTTTASSVAQQATLKNAMNLGKINLIGVYGSDKNRRALIRLSSGRYVKVKVGDRVDGGQVAAIGNNELRYVKSGRNITLTMPKG